MTTKELDSIISSGKTIRSDNVYIRFLPNETVKFAAIVPKKVAKTSVGRHLLKRKMFAALFEVKDLFPNGHYALFATNTATGMSTDEFAQEISLLIKKVAS